MADAFFSKETFVNPLFKEGFHVKSRLRNDAVLFYPTLQEPTGKRGHPKWYDGKVDFSSLDLSRFEEAEVDKGRLFGLKTYSKSLKRCIKVAVCILMKRIGLSGKFTSTLQPAHKLLTSFSKNWFYLRTGPLRT